MKIIVTGANGMLGSSLCRLYYDQHEVHALHRDEGCFTNCSADYSLDLINTKKVEELFNLIKPDLVIHCAGLTSVETCETDPALAYESNVTITENIARSCSNGTKLVYISTDQVYGGSNNHSETNMNLRPVNHYGKTKYWGEEKALEYCPDCIIVRTNIFGWNVKPKKVSSAEWIYNSLINGDEIILFTDYTFSPIYTENLGEIILQLVEIDFSGVVNIGSSIPCTKYEFGVFLAGEFDLSKSLLKKGSLMDHPFKAKRVSDIVLDISLLKNLGIWIPTYNESIKGFIQ